MCLAVPGRILSISDEPGGTSMSRLAKVDFQGSRLDVSLIFTPDAGVGDWILVHAGFSIRRLEEQEALETWEYLQAADLAEPELSAGELDGS